MELNNDEIKKLFVLFDRNHSGDIDYDEFLRIIRGPLSLNRQKILKQAFIKLDLNGDGVVTLDEIRRNFLYFLNLIEKYNAKLHPEVRAGKKNEEEVLIDFLDTFEQHHALLTGDQSARDGNVTWDEFLEYYNNISCSIDDDRYFELMIRNAWNLDK